MAAHLSNKIFHHATKARAWLESLLWTDGRVCGYCGTVDESAPIGGREGYYQCNACRKQFTVQVGTVFERSHIPLSKWLMAAFLLCASKKGISVHSETRDRWRLSHVSEAHLKRLLANLTSAIANALPRHWLCGTRYEGSAGIVGKRLTYRLTNEAKTNKQKEKAFLRRHNKPSHKDS